MRFNPFHRSIRSIWHCSGEAHTISTFQSVFGEERRIRDRGRFRRSAELMQMIAPARSRCQSGFWWTFIKRRICFSRCLVLAPSLQSYGEMFAVEDVYFIFIPTCQWLEAKTWPYTVLVKYQNLSVCGTEPLGKNIYVQNEDIMEAYICKWWSENLRNIKDCITSTGQGPISDENCDITRKYISLKQTEQSTTGFDSYIQALLWNGLKNNTNPPSCSCFSLFGHNGSWINPSNTSETCTHSHWEQLAFPLKLFTSYCCGKKWSSPIKWPLIVQARDPTRCLH